MTQEALPRMELRRFSAWLGEARALGGVSLDVRRNERLAIIGPAGSGKTTLLRSLNRMNDLEPGYRHEGEILLDGRDIHAPGVDVPGLRRRVGMVYATPVVLPWSIRANMTYGLRLQGRKEPTRSIMGPTTSSRM